MINTHAQLTVDGLVPSAEFGSCPDGSHDKAKSYLPEQYVGTPVVQTFEVR